MERTGVTVLMLLLEIGNEFPHNVEQIVLQILEIETVDVVRAFLHHNRAGGVVRRDADRPVLHARRLDDLADLLRHVVEGGDPTSRLQFQFLLKYDEFHCFGLLYVFFLLSYLMPFRRLPTAPPGWITANFSWLKPERPITAVWSASKTAQVTAKLVVP